ncbi:glycoside hydrolase family 97 protein [Aureitalea marina]|uniref:Alpha-glucosidase n=1 Tax=Aureitalea marina TaxID=930804 RepID=A0A2S7KRZ3_9FLAO|nr:glycoside hydrolase family 97 protein [Aureitalea marina]PQB05386.1 alpha-glucosidase [Aureitalea marina]
MIIATQNLKRAALLVVLVAFTACQQEESNEQLTTVSSPDGNNTIVFSLSKTGQPTYSVNHGDQEVILPSTLGFQFLDQAELKGSFEIVETNIKDRSETWEMPWGEQREVINNYNRLKIQLRETSPPNRLLNIAFRAYDDGIAFRYEFPEQDGLNEVEIEEEQTEFRLTGDHKSWWIPGDWDIYEHVYNTTSFTDIDAISKRDHPNLAATYIPHNAVNTPVTMRTDTGLHLSFHEANLTDYAGMTLGVNADQMSMTSILVGSENTEYKVKRTTPFKTPWRTIQIAEEAKDLIASNLIVNLNEPNKLGDVSWFKPMKYVGIWWEMHLDKSRWDYGMTREGDGPWEDTGQAHGRHGATTENAKRYIDFAAANNMSGLLVEGWNTGWERWIGFEDREGVFDFLTPYPDYDIQEVARYGNEKGVELIMHHETSAATGTYDKQIEAAYQLMQQLGSHSVKTGYVGKIIPKGEYHHNQYMVNHYRRALEIAAKYQVAINAHEPIKATGLRRTYPNAISREGLRGQEFNAWASDGGNPPEHLPIVAFTRMLAGPIDFTPGVFDIDLPTKPNNQINTTLAQQLALYVVIYSPIQMACDLPENYEGQPGLQFIQDVGVDWEQSVVLNGEVGEFVTIAREERESGNWFLGSITNEQAREISVSFDFLPQGVSYTARVYRDAQNAHYADNPTALTIEEIEIDRESSMNFDLAAGGGLAISLLINN